MQMPVVLAVAGLEDLVNRALDLDPGMRDVVRDRASRAWRRRIDVRARGERVTGTFVELVESAVASLGGTRASSGA